MADGNDPSERPPKNVTAAREKIPASREKIPASRKNVTAARDGWQQLTDRDLRRIAIEQMDQVGVAWSIDEPHRGMSPLYVSQSAEPLFFSFPKKRQVRGCIPQWVQPLGGCCLGKERAQAMTPYFGMLIAARINPRSRCFESIYRWGRLH